MFIYSRFESLIHETGVTKASIARRIGRTPTVCQDWKAGKSEPSADTRLRELLSHADDDLKQAMIAFLERFQKK